MGTTNEDYQHALSLAKQGKLQEAKAMLKDNEHPKAHLLLERINQNIATESQEKKGISCVQILAYGIALPFFGIILLLSLWNAPTPPRAIIQDALNDVVTIQDIRVNDGIIDVIYITHTNDFTSINNTTLEISCILRGLNLDAREHAIIANDSDRSTPVVQASLSADDLANLNCNASRGLSYQINRYYEYGTE